MLSFESDYIEGAHEQILRRLVETNMEQLPGYGSDRYCEQAAEKIKKRCAAPDAEVRFLTGGTQTNKIIIDTMLQKYEGVVAAATGHVSAHEAGAIEESGHKVLTLPAHDGKIKAAELEQFMKDFYADGNHEHMVFPGMVYISYPTEYGTLYSRQELLDIKKVCTSYELPLFIDGARLGYGLMSRDADITIQDIAQLCDVFYIGGTKVGALCGEAVVYTHHNIPAHFVTQVKQHGALLAKGRLLGVQFDTLFTEDLYFEISRHAIEMADRLKAAFRDKGYTFFLDSPTNQIFIVLENGRLAELEKSVAFGFWEKADDNHTVVRIATSWATTSENVDKLISLL